MADRLRCALHSTRQSERGQALLTILLVIGVGIAALVYTLATPANLSIANDKKTAAALAQAKAALIGRAASDQTIPGSLPCPDIVTNIPGTNIPNDGIADLFAGNQCPSYIGRLPWRTLGLPDLRDGSGERLWYALSPNFRDDSSASPLNSDTSGQLTITGTAPATNVIAIVFSPGAVVGTQVRNAANQNNATNYLEGGNEDGDTNYITGASSPTFNDKLLPITSDALFSVVAMRVAREVRTFLTTYFNTNGYYPFATRYTDPTYNCTLGVTSGRIPNPSALPNISVACLGLADWLPGVSQPPAWFTANNWHLVTHYALAPACTFPLSNLVTQCAGAGGLLTVQGIPAPNNDKRAIVIVTGRGLSGQLRPGGTSVTDYLEDPENTNGGDGDTVFIKPVLSPTDNDRLVVVSP